MALLVNFVVKVFIDSESAVQRPSLKKLAWKISENSEENTSIGVPFYYTYRLGYLRQILNAII